MPSVRWPGPGAQPPQGDHDEGREEHTRGLRRSCPRTLLPAPGWRSSDPAGVPAGFSIRGRARYARRQRALPSRSSGSVQSVHSVFFEPAGTDSFVATPATAGPWSAQAQHGGPPSALAARALELHEPDEGQRLAGWPSTSCGRCRSGRSRSGRGWSGRDGGWPCSRRSWRPTGRRSCTPAAGGSPYPRRRGPGHRGRARRRPPIPAEQPLPTFPGGHMTGYLDAIDWRYVAGGGFDVPGPAMVWARPKIPLIPDEDLTDVPRPAARGLGQRGERDPRPDEVPVHQRGPHGRSCRATRSANGCCSTRSPRSANGAPAWPRPRCRTCTPACGTAMQTLLVAPR